MMPQARGPRAGPALRPRCRPSRKGYAIRDKFTRGFIAGFLGDFAKAILDLFCFYVLHSVSKRYLDFSAFLVFGHLPHGWPEAVLAQAVEMSFSGVLGAIFVYLLDIIGSRHLFFKSAVYSMSTWFFAYGIPKVFVLAPFRHMYFPTALSHLITSTIEGFVVAYVLTRIGPEGTKVKEKGG